MVARLAPAEHVECAARAEAELAVGVSIAGDVLQLGLPREPFGAHHLVDDIVPNARLGQLQGRDLSGDWEQGWYDYAARCT